MANNQRPHIVSLRDTPYQEGPKKLLPKPAKVWAVRLLPAQDTYRYSTERCHQLNQIGRQKRMRNESQHKAVSHRHAQDENESGLSNMRFIFTCKSTQGMKTDRE